MDLQRQQFDQPAENIEAVMSSLRRIIHAMDLYSHYTASTYGLTGPQLVILKELAKTDGVGASDLARAAHLSQPTITGILDRLEKRGLITRFRSQTDKRCVVVALTEQGRELFAAAPPLLQENFTRQFNTLPAWEQTQILSSLQRVVAMMETQPLLSRKRPGQPGPWPISDSRDDFPAGEEDRS